MLLPIMPIMPTGGDICNFNVTAKTQVAGAAACIAACCHHPTCSKFVTVRGAPAWSDPGGTARAARPAPRAGIASTTDGSSTAAPGPTAAYTAGTVTPRLAPPMRKLPLAFWFLVAGTRRVLHVG